MFAHIGSASSESSEARVEIGLHVRVFGSFLDASEDGLSIAGLGPLNLDRRSDSDAWFTQRGSLVR